MTPTNKMTNRQYSKNYKPFIKEVNNLSESHPVYAKQFPQSALGVAQPTTRQASKFRRGKGVAFKVQCRIPIDSPR